jgi:hypothetical protein
MAFNNVLLDEYDYQTLLKAYNETKKPRLLCVKHRENFLGYSFILFTIITFLSSVLDLKFILFNDFSIYLLKLEDCRLI